MVDDYGADDLADDGVFHVWPAFVDLLAATSLLFISLVAAFIFVSNTEIGEAITQRRQLIRALKSVGGADSLYAIRDDAQFVRITVQADATFPFTEWRLKSLRPAGKQALDSIGGILKRESIESLYRQVRILGHTDQVPFVDNSSSNWELSAARAAVVARYLVDSAGLNPCKVSAAGMGPYYPLLLQDSSQRGLPYRQRMERNRRIEIEVVPARAAGVVEGPKCSQRGDRRF
jgi:flagellar motor protein MotB